MELTFVMSANLAFSSLKRLPVIGWSGPAGTTPDLSYTTTSRSLISASSSKNVRQWLSLHVGVDVEVVELPAPFFSRASSASRSSGDGDDPGDGGSS